jgi:hypothetical protein
MKRFSTVHGVWSVIAIASFVLGFWLSRGTGDSSAGEGGLGTEGSTRARFDGVRGNGEGGPGAGRLSRSGRRGESDRDRHLQVALSEEEIGTLGEKFRTAASPLDRRAAFSSLLEGLTVENARLMREQIADLPDDSAEFRDFHYAWGAIAGAEAILHGAETRKTDMAVTLSGWAGADPSAALKWWDALQDQPEKKEWAGQGHLMAGMVEGLADADPDLATGFVLGLAASDDGQARRLMGLVANEVLRTGGPVDASLWATGLPAGPMKTSTMGRVSYEYARKDPEAAVTWLESLPAGQDQSRGFGSAFSAWAGRDPELAGDYIKQMPKSPARDSAISGYATRVAHEDPSMAVEWGNAVSDPAIRENTLIRAGQMFYRRDAEAARDWLAASDLSPEAQKRVQNPPRRGR